jgi:GT2 family glycosyltransferase
VTASVGAVVVRWRGGAEVERCLRSLEAHGGGSLAAIVLVDSGSGDEGAERLARLFPGVQVLALSDNLSFAWATNQGAAALVDCPLVLLLNPDTELTPGCLDHLVGFVEERPAAAGAVPLLANPDGSSQHLWQLRRLPSPWRLACGRAGPAQVPGPVPGVPLAAEQPAAAAWLVRRPVWEALDGLDTSFAPAWWEDVDFCARLAGRLGTPGFPASEGWWLVPEARVVHHGGSSVAHLGDAQFLTHFHRNLLGYARRHHPRAAGMIAAGVRASLLARALARPARRAAYLEALRALRG